jgi:TonB family protein
MSPGNAPARQRAPDFATDTRPALGSPQVPAPAHLPAPDTPECDSLAQILDARNQRPMLRLQALQIMEGVCRSLDHTHRNGGIHGNVQPENIFVTAEGHVRLTGHGEAPTAVHASCEVLEGAPPIAADDLFSAACVGYRLLAGEPPFGLGNALEAEAAGQRPARIEHLPPGQWRALDRALTFRRTDRQPDIETFLNELRSQYPGQSAADAATTAKIPVLAAIEPRRDLRLLVTAGVVSAVAVITLVWWMSRTPEEAASTTQAESPAEAAEPEAGRIVRAETAATPDLPPASPPPQAASPAAAPEPLVLPTQTEPRVTVIPSAVTPAAEAPTTSTPSREPAAPPATLIAPLPVVPVVPIPAAPALAINAKAAVDAAIYMVPFSSLKVRRYADPDYPRTSAGQRVAGWVDVSFGLDAVGRTTDMQVTDAEPAGLFEDAALAAVKRWRFAPVEAPAGTDQQVRSEIRVRFIPD